MVENSEHREVGFSLEVDKYIRRFFRTLDLKFVVPDLYNQVIREVERPLIQIALETTDGNRIQAAKILGINRNTLLKKMRMLGLDDHEGNSRYNRKPKDPPKQKRKKTK